MGARLHPTKLVHVNQLVDDHDGTTAALTGALGARVYWENYDPEQNRDATLMVIGDLCVELFAPRDHTSALGAALVRYGPGWHSFEWHVPDLAEAKAALDERGVRIAMYRPGMFLTTHPADCHGMMLELCPLEMHGDPRIEPGWDPTPWRDTHPLGVVGLNALTIAVRDVPAATAWLLDLVEGASVVPRPGEGVGIRVADHVVELVATTNGAQRLRSVELGVTDVDRAAAHLDELGLPTKPGSRQDTRAFDLDGARWEIAPA
jgi:hypothetical protein